MPASAPPVWRAYAGMLLRRRPPALTVERLPEIQRENGPVRLNPDWLAQYRALIGLERDSQSLPPLALQMAAAPLHLSILADESFPFRAMGLVHVAQRIDQVKPVKANALLTLDASTGRLWPVRRGTQFEMITEARVDGRLVWRSVVTAMSRHARGEAPPAPPPVSSLFPAEPTYWRRTGVIDVDEDLGRRYAAVAGDWNPIHQRAWLARRFGFPKAVVHGTWTLARALVQAGWPWREAYSIHAQFRKAVFLPSGIVVWTHAGPAVQHLRVTDEDGTVEHLAARVEPALP